MRKSKLLAGQYGVYAVFDKVSKHYRELIYASTDEEFVKLFLPRLIVTIPLRDMTVFKIAIFNDVTGELTKCVRKRVDLNCYRFPQTRLSPDGENLSLEKIEEELIKAKNKIIADSSNSDESENKEDK